MKYYGSMMAFSKGFFINYIELELLSKTKFGK